MFRSPCTLLGCPKVNPCILLPRQLDRYYPRNRRLYSSGPVKPSPWSYQNDIQHTTSNRLLSTFCNRDLTHFLLKTNRKTKSTKTSGKSFSHMREVVCEFWENCFDFSLRKKYRILRKATVARTYDDDENLVWKML